ncbi:tyrosine--tRNA ligase-like [Octopus sinensis]|uniref:Tyrosine--tRNA ligase-like n=1 Tax=Octopus sinensis TaxID=2607531 RepID=A0A6P7U2G9_9MOLL|nr:tyrosine--tRNA ligase-like [Octopus sinensis]
MIKDLNTERFQKLSDTCVCCDVQVRSNCSSYWYISLRDSQVKLRVVGGEIGASSTIAPRIAPLGLPAKKVAEDIAKSTTDWKGIKIAVQLRIQNQNSRYIDRLFTRQELQAKLESGNSLNVKYGIDITGPSLHLGHAVNLWLLRAFQERGHAVDLVLGDFTTKVGDPTDKLNSRCGGDCLEDTILSYLRQIDKILLTNSSKLRVHRNSEWYKKMTVPDFIRLTSMGYDSVVLGSDITVVGSDQHFNEDMARHLQTRHNQRPQTLILTPITPGLGLSASKQSKSLGNYIGIDLSPRDMFGMAMRVDDKHIIRYLRVYTTMSLTTIEDIENQITQGGNPRDAKLMLAKEITRRYHGDQVANEELDYFVETFSNRNPKLDSIKCVIERQMSVSEFIQNRLANHYGESGLVRVADAGGIRVNGDKLSSSQLSSRLLCHGDLLRVGKKNIFYIEMLDHVTK